MEALASRFRVSNQLVREALAEFLGTFILLTIGDGSVAQAVLSKGEDGDHMSIHWSWGVGVTMGIYVAGGVSGGHLNPAVSMAQACLGRLPWRSVPVYMLAQYLGAFLASTCVFFVYYDALNNFDGGTRQVDGTTGTAGIWATYPKPYVTTGNCFGDQILGTALLLILVLAITDRHNMQPSRATTVNILGTALLLIMVLAITDRHNMQPSRGETAISVGLVVFAIGMTFGLNCGYAINPARDLGPRIFTSLAGWGTAPFTYRDHNYFWVPVVGPHVGAIIGAIVYQLCVGLHWPRAGPQGQTDVGVHQYDGPASTISKM